MEARSRPLFTCFEGHIIAGSPCPAARRPRCRAGPAPLPRPPPIAPPNAPAAHRPPPPAGLNPSQRLSSKAVSNLVTLLAASDRPVDLLAVLAGLGEDFCPLPPEAMEVGAAAPVGLKRPRDSFRAVPGPL